MRRGVARWVRSPAGVVGGSVLLTVVLAFAANAVLNLSHVDPAVDRLRSHSITEELPLFLLGTFVVWLFVVLLLCTLGRLWLSVGLVTTATMLVGFANYRKQQLLTEPLYPSDLAFVSSPGFLAEMVDPAVLLTVLTLSVAVVGTGVLTGRWAGRWFPRPGRRVSRRLGRAMAGARLAGVVGAMAAISSLMQFHEPGNLFKAAYNEYGVRWRPWHQSANYVDNGFVAGMLYNLPVPAMRRPPDYGPATMRELVRRYSRLAGQVNRGRDPAALAHVNVVFVLGEAFTDPTRFRAVRFAEDPIPYTRALMGRTTAGNMWSPQYGGGTANVEFEALTGLSLAQFRPQMTTPYQMLVPGHDEFPSGARVLEQHGLKTLALHSYTSALYRRTEVYPVLGFDDAVFQDEMTHTETLQDNPFVSDRAAYEEVLIRLQQVQEPMFVQAVTMQNHYPMAGKYAHPIAVAGLPGAEATETLAHYARGLRYSDAAMRHFIARLEAIEDKTVVVFYGDHLPPVWPSSVLRKRIAHETPFFVYANFGEPKAERLPTTSPIYFMNHVLDLTNAYVSPFHVLLQRLEREIPALGHGIMIGPADERLTPDELSDRARRLLRDYRLVQYDISVGKQYGAEALFDPFRSRR